MTDDLVYSSPWPSVEVGLAQLTSAVEARHPDADLGLLRRGLAFLERLARDAPDSSPINLSHALETARVLADMRLDPAAVTAALVAAVTVHGGAELDAIRGALGDEVADLLEGVVRLGRIRWDRIEEEAAESLRKMFLAMARDVRVVLVVLAMRVQMMRALRDGDLPDAEQKRVAREALEVFAPLANRLGIWQLKWELEDWALRVLDPQAFNELTRLLSERREERNAFIGEVIDTLKKRLRDEGIEATVKGRAKHVYSIYKKMQRKELNFEQIYDVSAVRVTTERIPDCYAVLGMVHSLWVPVPGEFDDYIAKPKDNGYQSLHTAVIGPRGRPVEVQIRTQEMNQYAEFGVAAHWAYKERKKSTSGQEKFAVLRQLMDWERDVNDPHQFVESLKTDVFKDQIFVFTPNGDIIDLPLGSTPLDFAYRVHTMVGHRCRGARVNGHIQPLDHQLATGDRVEILTHKEGHPSRDWMNPSFGFLKTSSARQKVRQWFRLRERTTAIHEGKELIEKELARLELGHTTLAEIAHLLKYPHVDDMFAAVGYGDRSSQSIASAALQIEREKAPPEEPPLPPSVPLSKKKTSASGLRLDGVDDILGKRARCCNPVPGDDVVGFVTRGRGIMIHRRDCTNLARAAEPEPERIVDISWGPGVTEKHMVEVEIRAQDSAGLLRDMSTLVSSMGVNITSARAEGNRGGSAWLRLSLELASADEIVKVMQRIDRHPDVLEVRRVGR
jgi:GTP pyrophosphokinase